jgi:hypothetical protein
MHEKREVHGINVLLVVAGRRREGASISAWMFTATAYELRRWATRGNLGMVRGWNVLRTGSASSHFLL